MHKTPIHSLSWECCNKVFQCLVSRCPNFHCNWKMIIIFFWGGPCTRGPPNFVHPAHPIATLLTVTRTVALLAYRQLRRFVYHLTRVDASSSPNSHAHIDYCMHINLPLYKTSTLRLCPHVGYIVVYRDGYRENQRVIYCHTFMEAGVR